MIASVQRADRLLDLFSGDVTSWSISEMARELGISKSIVWEYVKTLEDLGLLRKAGRNHYRLGWRNYQLGIRARLSSEIAEPARIELHNLASELQESVQLVTRHKSEVIYLEKIVPANGIRINSTRVGDRLPAHTTASGKLLLSILTETELEQLYPAKELSRRTGRSIGTRETLNEHLLRISRQGFGEDREESIKGICGIAVPIENQHGDMIWALSVSFYEYKWATHAERYRDVLKRAAQRLSKPTQMYDL